MTFKKEAAADAAMQTVHPDEEEIPPEILAAIAAAAAAFLGTSLRIGTVELQRSSQGAASRWSRRGRSLVSASHNLRRKRQGISE